MRKNAPEVPLDPDPAEQRRRPRKSALLSGVIADVNGENVSDCIIRDIHAHGAQIGFSKKLPMDSQIYLLDTSNQNAYLANVAWNNSHRAGLSFVQSYAVGFALPPKLKFLWRLLLEAKLREVDRAVSKGITVGLAWRSVGLAEVHLDQMAQHSNNDEKFERLLLLAKRLMNNSPE